MQDFERVYMRTLRHIYDTEKQLVVSLPALSASLVASTLGPVVDDIAAQSSIQSGRITEMFRLLYLEPQAEASWTTTALLRDAWDACETPRGGGVHGCAAALLAVKRYEITLYEALLRWSEHCGLDEAIPDLRRSIAEELVQASILSEHAFDIARAPLPVLSHVDSGALH